MKVSVCLLTYNHVRYIAQAIDSVLIQKTDFDFEVVIGEDASTDGTRKVVEEYALRHPGQIRAILQPRNVGAGKNSMDTWKACRGRYIALLEGDDYWTSSHKLQKQADALDAHPEWTVCYHRVRRFSQDAAFPPSDYPRGPQKPVLTLKDLLHAGNPMQTCSVMYRGGVVPELPTWFRDLGVGDWAMHLLHAARGQVGFIDELMADYRIHGEGAWASRSKAYREEKMADMFHRLGMHLGGAARPALLQRSGWLYFLAAFLHLSRKEFGRSWRLLLKGSRTAAAGGLPIRLLGAAVRRHLRHAFLREAGG